MRPLRIKNFLIFLFGALFTTQSLAQKPFYRNYTVEDGLVSSTVYSIHQDRHGFLWFGTESGVSRFDGIFFKNYGRLEGLGDNEIFFMFEDSKDRIWFFPFNGRLSYYSGGDMINGRSDSLLRALEINSLFMKPFEDKEGNLWIGTHRDNAIAFYGNDKSALLSIPHRYIEVMAVQDGSVQFRSGKHLYTHSLSWEDGIPVLGEEVSRDTFLEEKETLPHIEEYEISDFLIDRESNKWYTTLGSGVLMRSRTYVNFLDKETGLDFDNVYSIVNVFDSSLLTGFQNGTLQRWNRTQSIKTVLGKSVYNRILDIYIHDDLWIASDRGLFVLDKNTLDVKYEHPGSIKCLARFEDDLYYGTSSGAYRVAFSNPDSIERIYNKRSISILVNEPGNVLIGTNKGLVQLLGDSVYDRSGDHRLLSGRVRAMTQLKTRVTAMGTHGEGVLLKSGENYYVLDMDHGLSSNICHAIFRENDSTMWLGTNNGLNKIRFQNEDYENPIVDVYKRSDGLKSNYINDIFVNKEEVFVASDKGVSFFEIPKEQKKAKPITYLYELKIADSTVELKDHYELKHDENKLEISYSAVAFESGKNTKFKYRILGLDSQWVYTDRRTLSFQAIPPGDYEFQVYALATDGSRSEEVAGFEFKINKPFWKTNWFIGLVILIIAFAIWRITRFIIAYNHRKDVEERNKALHEKNEIIELERERSENLLLNILPEDIASELKAEGSVTAKKHELATVFFSDFEGFTNLAAQVSPEELVNELDHCFGAYDAIIDKYGLEKVKTIGDAYMCAAGLNEDTTGDPHDVIRAAFEIMDFMDEYAAERQKEGRPHFRARIGVHTGAVVSGVVGVKKFAFDIWGDTVNTAARMETNGVVGELNISKDTYELIKDEFDCESRGTHEVKGKGEMEMFFVHRRPSSKDNTSG